MILVKFYLNRLMKAFSSLFLLLEDALPAAPFLSGDGEVE
jgi:hypothetical protein